MKKTIALLAVLVMLSVAFVSLAESTLPENEKAFLPFSDITWQSTYDDMIAIGLEAEQGPNNYIAFINENVEINGYKINVIYFFNSKTDELTLIEGDVFSKQNDYIQYFNALLQYFTNYYGKEFEITDTWADKVSEINGKNASDDKLNEFIFTNKLSRF